MRFLINLISLEISIPKAIEVWFSLEMYSMIFVTIQIWEYEKLTFYARAPTRSSSISVPVLIPVVHPYKQAMKRGDPKNGITVHAHESNHTIDWDGARV